MEAKVELDESTLNELEEFFGEDLTDDCFDFDANEDSSGDPVISRDNFLSLWKSRPLLLF